MAAPCSRLGSLHWYSADVAYLDIANVPSGLSWGFFFVPNVGDDCVICKILKKPSSRELYCISSWWQRYSHMTLLKRFFHFPKCHSLQGNNFLSFGLAGTPCSFLWPAFLSNKTTMPSTLPPYHTCPPQLGPGFLNQGLLQLTLFIQENQRPYGFLSWNSKS